MDEYKARILVVDDEESIRNVLARKLESAGYTCDTASDGNDALWKAFMQDYDLMLSDIKMPGMSGMEVLSQMITDHPDTGVIMVTAMSDIQLAVEAMKIGAFDYVTKPFNLDDLIIRVERSLERRKLIMENREYQFRLEQRIQRHIGLAQQYYQEAIEALAREELALEKLHSLQKSTGLDHKELDKEHSTSSNRIKEFTKKILQLVSGDLPDSVKEVNHEDEPQETVQHMLENHTKKNSTEENESPTITSIPHADIVIDTTDDCTSESNMIEDTSEAYFSGSVELVATPASGLSDILQIYERLKADPCIKVNNMGGSIESGLTIKISLDNPIQLVKVLKNMPEVFSASEGVSNTGADTKTIVLDLSTKANFNSTHKIVDND